MERSWCSRPATNRPASTNSTSSRSIGSEQVELRVVRPQLRLCFLKRSAIAIALIETVTLANLANAFVDLVGIRSAQVRDTIVAFPIAAHQQRKSLFQK